MISRNPSQSASAQYDLIIVGGGIYGATLALEAARRNLTPLLLERDDFGGATSWNSLRIVHGGLRYLQSLDLRRFGESVAERKWFLQNFPDLVRPLSCLMPLYGKGLRRPWIFRLALQANDWFSRSRNDGVRGDCRLGGGRVLGDAETVSLFEKVDRSGLRGGALWHDAVMPDSERLLIEILHWACAAGATCLNYVEATNLLKDSGRVRGVQARDVEADEEHEFEAPVVVNCAGPWSRQLVASWDRDAPSLFRPSLAFNIFLDREPLSSVALAVAPKRTGGRTYFLHPWRGRIFAGTYHAPAHESSAIQEPHEEQIRDFLEDLNSAIPGFSVNTSDVLRVHWGLLPAARKDSADLAVREVLLDHAERGGPEGLFSVSGVKFTTARRVAEKTLHMIAKRRGTRLSDLGPARRPTAQRSHGFEELAAMLDREPKAVSECVGRLVTQEAVQHLDDLFMRRTDWGTLPDLAITLAKRIVPLLGWDENRRAQELKHLEAVLAGRSHDKSCS